MTDWPPLDSSNPTFAGRRLVHTLPDAGLRINCLQSFQLENAGALVGFALVGMNAICL
jgi:hypothetical protein